MTFFLRLSKRMNKFYKKLKQTSKTLETLAKCESKDDFMRFVEAHFDKLIYDPEFVSFYVERHLADFIAARDELKVKGYLDGDVPHLKKCADPKCKHKAHDAAKRSLKLIAAPVEVIKGDDPRIKAEVKKEEEEFKSRRLSLEMKEEMENPGIIDTSKRTLLEPVQESASHDESESNHVAQQTLSHINI